MGFFGSLFGDKIANENKTKPIFKCTTRGERADWFARTRPWNKVPLSVVDAVVTQLESQPPVMLELFIQTSMNVGLIPQFERLPASAANGEVACAAIGGMFMRVGGPLAQQFMQTKASFTGRPTESQVNALIKQAGLAKDCLELSLRICPNMIPAYGVLAALLVQSGQMPDALQFAEEGLAVVQALRSSSTPYHLSSIEAVRSAPDDFATAERQLQSMIDALKAEPR